MLELYGIKKSFGEKRVLNGIDLTVHSGDVVAVLGPSGAGKTTLLRCINFLERAEDGEMTFDNTRYSMKTINRAQIAGIRKKTAFVFQDYQLFFNKTALQNVTEGLIIGRRMKKKAAEDIGMAMLKKVGMEEFRDTYPERLSGGQKQRVAIARALATDPKIIYFDEPTSALDPELTGEVLSVMRALAAEGRTMLVVTHEIGFARNVSNKVVFLENGAVVECAPTKEFFTNPKEARTREFLRAVDGALSK